MGGRSACLQPDLAAQRMQLKARMQPSVHDHGHTCRSNYWDRDKFATNLCPRLHGLCSSTFFRIRRLEALVLISSAAAAAASHCVCHWLTGAD